LAARAVALYAKWGGVSGCARATVGEQLSDPQATRTMLRIAADYERLAEHAERRATKETSGAT